MGIPPEDLARIFDKFYRVQRPESVSGTGLGLSISKGIVEAHHGNIYASAREGGGTMITIELPLNDDHRNKTDESKQANAILVVDDEAPIRRYLRAALSAQGFTIYEAANGQEALNAVIADRPDIIILDLGLPDIDGIEVTRRLREWSQTPIIILSVREAEQDKIAALDAGADDYLTKPFGTGELMARMRVAMRRLASKPDEPILQVDELQMDLSRRVVTVRGR